MKSQEKIKSLIKNALSLAMNNTSDVGGDVRMHLKQALNNLEKQENKKQKNKIQNKNQFEQWWGNVQSGVLNNKFSEASKESQLGSLNKLNALIRAEQLKTEETNINKPNKSNTLSNTNFKNQELIIE